MVGPCTITRWEYEILKVGQIRKPEEASKVIFESVKNLKSSKINIVQNSAKNKYLVSYNFRPFRFNSPYFQFIFFLIISAWIEG